MHDIVVEGGGSYWSAKCNGWRILQLCDFFSQQINVGWTQDHFLTAL